MADDYKEFLCEYDHEGSRWSFTIKARDFADAEARVRRLSLARVNGEVMFSAKIAPDWFGRLFSRGR